MKKIIKIFAQFVLGITIAVLSGCSQGVTTEQTVEQSGPNTITNPSVFPYAGCYSGIMEYGVQFNGYMSDGKTPIYVKYDGKKIYMSIDGKKFLVYDVTSADQSINGYYVIEGAINTYDTNNLTYGDVNNTNLYSTKLLVFENSEDTSSDDQVLIGINGYAVSSDASKILDSKFPRIK